MGFRLFKSIMNGETALCTAMFAMKCAQVAGDNITLLSNITTDSSSTGVTNSITNDSSNTSTITGIAAGCALIILAAAWCCLVARSRSTTTAVVGGASLGIALSR